MTLNFPADTSNPYIDPSSGLKYVFNGAVGAWETALQPPVVVSDTAPDLNIPGFLWWDSVGGSLYVRYNDGVSEQWVEAVPSAIAKQSFVAPTAPALATSGDIWWNTIERKLYIKSENAWEDVALRVNDYVADTTPVVTFSHVAPATTKRGDLWYSKATGRLHVYSDEVGYEGWKSSSPGSDSIDIGVGTITTDYTLSAVKLDQNVTLTAKKATTALEGVVRFATQAEVNSGTGLGALTPTSLKIGIDNYVDVPEAASDVEAMAGTSTDKFISPASLAKVHSQMSGGSNPTGTVIHFAGTEAPDGYVLCDGAAVSRTEYASLFSVIGTTYGIGNGATTFNLPDVSGTIKSYIKF